MKESENARIQRKFLEEYSNTLDIRASARAAGYKKQTGVANALNYLTGERGKRELRALIAKKTQHLEVCKGYIILSYLQILDWALSKDDEGHITEPTLALRALDGLTKQLTNGFQTGSSSAQDTYAAEAQNPSIITSIVGLDPKKI